VFSSTTTKCMPDMSVTCPVCQDDSAFARLYLRDYICACVWLCERARERVWKEWVHACVRVYAQVCAVKCDIFTIPHLYVSDVFLFWLLQPDCLFYAFGCCLASAPARVPFMIEEFCSKMTYPTFEKKVTPTFTKMMDCLDNSCQCLTRSK